MSQDLMSGQLDSAPLLTHTLTLARINVLPDA